MPSEAGRYGPFKNVISSEQELRAIHGHAGPRLIAKVTDTIDAISRDFIARSPFVLVASSDGAGNVDVSPKGDPAGFVQVLDQHTLAIPDRPGNRRADTFSNVLCNPHVGLIFLVPGKRETLRVSGTAQIVRDEELRASMAVDGKPPELALVVTVREVFMHCAKCMIRSGMWEANTWPESDGLATLAEAMVAHGKLTMPVAELSNLIETDAKTRLY